MSLEAMFRLRWCCVSIGYWRPEILLHWLQIWNKMKRDPGNGEAFRMSYSLHREKWNVKSTEPELRSQDKLATSGAVCFSSIELIWEHFRLPKPMPLQEMAQPAFFRTIWLNASSFLLPLHRHIPGQPMVHSILPSKIPLWPVQIKRINTSSMMVGRWARIRHTYIQTPAPVLTAWVNLAESLFPHL